MSHFTVFLVAFLSVFCLRYLANIQPQHKIENEGKLEFDEMCNFFLFLVSKMKLGIRFFVCFGRWRSSRERDFDLMDSEMIIPPRGNVFGFKNFFVLCGCPTYWFQFNYSFKVEVFTAIDAFVSLSQTLENEYFLKWNRKINKFLLHLTIFQILNLFELKRNVL